MRALTLTEFGSTNVMQVRETPMPRPGRGQVRIKVQRAGVNFADIMARLGLYPDVKSTPIVLGYEVSGHVDALGDGVTGLQVGDAVVAGTRFGGQAEFALADAALTLPLPKGMTFEVAAAIPVNYLTAAWMLHEVRRVRRGDKLLIHSASGGVGVAVGQLCRRVGDVTVFGTASAGKHDFVRSHGITHPIDYRSQDYAEEIRKVLGADAGLDAVLDPLGGKDWKKGYDLLATGGLLVTYGWSNMAAGTKRNVLHLLGEVVNLPLYTPMKLMDQNRGVIGVNLGHLWDEGARLRRLMEDVLAGCAAGELQPHVGEVVPLSEGARAHEVLQGRSNLGKVLLDCTR